MGWMDLSQWHTPLQFILGERYAPTLTEHRFELARLVAIVETLPSGKSSIATINFGIPSLAEGLGGYKHGLEVMSPSGSA
ncbi:hypothetical protein EGR_09436 [Echinococcus granulosus]|uniref:Uncharacterized protein n=1 Tax=Echinococcus granulosus TaxID=6210 RepID=W6U3P3_ECHGR|nr:hypothetical protein EGR_09436 [Echinococcus granulosus]EUB55723.1 hypothetical protein EGR_09436 [Echinococcus granulosus]